MDKVINSVHISVNRCKLWLKFTLHFEKLMNFTKKPLFISMFTGYPRKCPIWLLIGIRRRSCRRISARDSHFLKLLFFQYVYVMDAYVLSLE